MRDGPGPMLPAGWDTLAPLLDRLLDAPDQERPRLLDELAAGDATRRSDLERLMAECQRASPLLDRPAVERFDRLLGEETEVPPPPVLGGRYRIERELGRGGMARVYLAQDSRHARPVAVKVIRPDLAASLGRDRFLREIGIAARLRHPNIVPLFDSGDTDGLLYYVMPYEEGQSLRARLEREGRLASGEAVSILRDVARALAHAHERGIMHRDIKPDNVLLSGDAAVVTDFGIAKAFSLALTDSRAAASTRIGVVMGTPAYMAPERGLGDPASDHRADLYSFGCLAYEVFAGQPPFVGATTYEVVAAQMSSAPPPLPERRPDVPPAVAELIARCLEKNPAARPQSAAELLEVLGSVSSLEGLPVRRRRRAGPRAFLGAALLLAVLAVGYFVLRGMGGGRVTVAVLPFLSAGGDSTQSLLAEGFSDDLAAALVKVPWIRVMSRGGAGNYGGQTDVDIRGTGKLLGASYLVTGSLREVGGRRLFIVRLLSCDDASVLWADTYDRPAELAVLRDRIVQTIGDSLRSRSGTLAARGAIAPARRHANNDAYLLYLLGKRKLNDRGPSIAESITLFRRAIGLDSLSAEAWSGLSLALAVSVPYHDASADSVAPEATASAQRALRLDPALAEPHTALGMLLEFQRQWPRAEAELAKAIELDPHDVEARVQYARVLSVRGRLAESLDQLEKARDDDPASALVLSHLAATRYARGDLDRALVESERAMQSNPSNLTTLILRAAILAGAGRAEEARRLARAAPPYNEIALYALALAGDTAIVGERLGILASGSVGSGRRETARALGWLGRGDTAQALDALERATAAREIWPWLVPPGWPMYDRVRQSARFHSLLGRVGLEGPEP